MTLTIKEFESLDSIGEQAWSDLFNACPSATYFQSWNWLTAWWNTFNAGKAWIVTAWEGKKLCGAAALFIDTHDVLRLIGEGHADYGQFLAAEDNASVLNALVDYIFSSPGKWRHAQLHCLPSDSYLANVVQAKGGWQSSKMACPRVLFETKSADTLLAKSSLKRHAKKLASLGKVDVKHIWNQENITPYVERFFTQHQERWSITPSPSLFTQPENKKFYRRLIEGAQSKGSLLFTAVCLNGKPVAMHLGFISQHQLIWYKPTYDPRLSSTGVGEVLLAELIREASRLGLEGIDFTRGDEAFKFRFSSETREVITLEAASRTWVKTLEKSKFKLHDILVWTIDSLRLHRPVARAVHNTKAALRVLRNKGPKAAYKAIREHLAKHGTKHVDIFVRIADDEESKDSRITLIALKTLDDLLRTLDLNDLEHLEVLSDAPAYLKAGAKLWIGLCDEEIVSCGWQLNGYGVDITEVQARLSFTGNVVCLMEFRTFSKHQCKGYYTALLKCISHEKETDHHLIYALSNNIASVKAIKKAGFVYAGRVTRSALGALRFRAFTDNPALSANSLVKKK